MRRISSKQTEAKRRKKNQIIVSVVLIFLMFFSVFGYAFGGGSTDPNNNNIIEYNGFEFQNRNGLWVLNRGDFSFIFSYNPEEINRTFPQVNTLDNYYQKPLYLYSKNVGAGTEIYSNLNQVVLRLQQACPEGQECENENLVTKTCEDNMIIIKESNESLIKQENNCVLIYGPQEDIVKLTDEFLFETIGIM